MGVLDANSVVLSHSDNVTLHITRTLPVLFLLPQKMQSESLSVCM
jgi:hypothetical protein